MDASRTSVANDILAISVGCASKPFTSPGHDERMNESDMLLGDELRLFDELFHFFQGRIVAEDFLFVPFSIRKMFVLLDDKCNLLVGETVALDHGRVMG